jgi:hypothetical protein
MRGRGVRWAGHVGRVDDLRNAYNILVGKLEETTLKI